MTHLSTERDAILDTALHLALHRGWHGFGLRELAEARALSLAELNRHFRSRDDLAEALFDRADDTLLSLPLDPQEPMHERLLTGIMVWLDYLAPYRPLVKEILGYKLEPGHLHLQAHGVTRISRTVQWLLETADWTTGGWRRTSAELTLTGIYLTAVASFVVDASDNLNTTRTLVHGLLGRSGPLLQ
ncbi:AcrR family transcriptional regulator [Oceanisphaera litoralis]|uniref:TetR/AcrR family transcriptional regulator n=1 Tax=Oceanisphaera litoralis TaxID=225144 RepID=UPI00195A6910|nr:TetR/AcrR family transcriptional regulator [Oceanisphaera litoralis]MBM7456395.1 AcrR family transcriptional regulator [Oceanisphaera litoralis]